MYRYRLYLAIILWLSASSLTAQRVIFPNENWFIRQSDELTQLLERGDTATAISRVLSWDPILDSLQKDYPLFVSLMKADQAFFLISPKKVASELSRKGYQKLQESIGCIGGNGKTMLDSLSFSLLQTAKRYKAAGLIDLLRPFDQAIRKAIPSKTTKLNDFSISYYQWGKDVFYHKVAANLTQYEELFLTPLSVEDSQEDHVGRSMNSYFQLLTYFKEWKADPESVDVNVLFKAYQAEFKVSRNGFESDRRRIENQVADTMESELDRLQANLYGLYLNDWAEVAMVARETGIVSNYLFLYLNDILKPRFLREQKAGRSLSQTYFFLRRTIPNLTTFLNQSGQYQLCKTVLDDAKSVFYDPDKGVDVRSSDVQPLWVNHWAQYIRAGLGTKDLGELLAAGFNLASLKADVPLPAYSDLNTNDWKLFLQIRSLNLEWELARREPILLRWSADTVKKHLTAVQEYMNRTGKVSIPGRAAYLCQAAQLQWEIGDYDASARLVGEAIENLDRSDPIESDLYFRAFALSVKLQTREHKSVTDTDALTQLLDHTRMELVRQMPSLSPDQRTLFYANSLQPYFDLYHSLLAEGYLDGMHGLRDSIIEQSLALKNYFSANTGMVMQDGKVSEEVRQYESIRRGFAALEATFSLYGDTVNLRSVFRNRIKTELEVRTRISTSTWDSLFALRRLTDIQKQLGVGDLYAEYVRFVNCFRRDTVCYFAILLEGNARAPRVRSLFKEADLQSTLDRSLQYSASNQPGQRGLRGLQPDRVVSVARDADTLGRFLFDPMPELAAAKQFVFIPDGLLNRVAFAALRWRGSFLFEQVAIRQLSASGRLQAQSKWTDSFRFLLAGAIRYERPGCNTDSRFRFLRPGLSWNYLPGSEQEVSRLSSLLRGRKDVKVRVTNDLTDSSDLSGYTHLHLATHGFYFSAKEAKADIEEHFNLDYLLPSPLARCGLVVNDANCSGTSGYLLGFMLANMDLNKCRLITLSACETALGDILSNQGVLGLQRALKIAGAQKLLVAMWKIPDLETAEFMDSFYRQLISGATEEESLRRTQSVLSKKYPISSWGAFTLID